MLVKILTASTAFFVSAVANQTFLCYKKFTFHTLLPRQVSMMDQAAEIAHLAARIGMVFVALLIMAAYLQLVERKFLTCIPYRSVPTPSKHCTTPSDVISKPFQPEGGEADGERKHQGP
jgi:hypothetical protein